MAAKKAKNETQEMAKLHVLYTQESKGGKPKGKGAYASRTDQHTTTTFKGAVLGEDVPYGGVRYSTFEVPKVEFDKGRTQVFAVVGYYSDGDSFGNSYGNMHIVDVYGNPDKAYAVARVLQKESKAETESIFGSQFRVPWGGYFAHLERVEVETLAVIRRDMIVSGDSTDPNDIPSW